MARMAFQFLLVSLGERLMKNTSGYLPVKKRSRALKRWLIVATAVVLMIILPAWACFVVLLLSIVALLLGLFAVVFGRIRWARIPNRKIAGGVAVWSVGLMLASFVGIGIDASSDTEQIQAFAETVASEPSKEADLASFVDQTCEADHLVMTQGNASNYCDKNESGIFVWADQTTHDQTVAQAKEEAEKKAAVEAKAKEEAEKKAAAEAKAKEEAAKQKAAAKKVAQEKAEKKATAAKKAAAEQAAAEARALAEQEAEAESLVEDTAGSSAYYANCTAVRAAGAAPIYSGDPGYSRKLDRDGDGVACE